MTPKATALRWLFLCLYRRYFFAAGALDLIAFEVWRDFHFQIAAAAGQERKSTNGSHEVADLPGLLFGVSCRF